MIVRLIRKETLERAVFGELHVDGSFLCYTLEDPKDVFAGGNFTIIAYWSPHFSPKLKMKVPLIIGIPRRRFIEIHPGNDEHDTAGCVLPAMKLDRAKQRGERSRDAWDLFMVLFNAAISRKEAVSIDVSDVPLPLAT